MASVGVIPALFVGEADACERMVAGLQYCSFLPLKSNISPTQQLRPMTIQQITSLVEKGVLYREMIDLRELSLLDQAFYITQKFTEFGERLEIIDADMKIKKLSANLILYALVNKAREIHDFYFSNTKLLKVFQIIRIQDLYVIFHQNHSNPLESVCLVICADVIVINFSWGNVDALVDSLQESLLPMLHPAASFDLNLICVVRGHSTLGDSVTKLNNFHERDESDEQMLIFHEFLQTLQFEERTKSINTLKAALSGVDRSLAEGDRNSLLGFLETGKIPYEDEEPRPISSQLIQVLERAQQQLWEEQDLTQDDEKDTNEVVPTTCQLHELEPLSEGGEGEEEPSPIPLPAPISPVRVAEYRQPTPKVATPVMTSPDAKAGSSSSSSRPGSAYKMWSAEDKFAEEKYMPSPVPKDTFIASPKFVSDGEDQPKLGNDRSRPTSAAKASDEVVDTIRVTPSRPSTGSSRPPSSYKLDLQDQPSSNPQVQLTADDEDICAKEHELLGESEPTLENLASEIYHNEAKSEPEGLSDHSDQMEAVAEQQEHDWQEQEKNLEALLADTKSFLSNSRPSSAYKRSDDQKSQEFPVGLSRPSSAIRPFPAAVTNTVAEMEVSGAQIETAESKTVPTPERKIPSRPSSSNTKLEVQEGLPSRAGIDSTSTSVTNLPELSRLKTPQYPDNNRNGAGMVLQAAQESASPVKGQQMDERKHNFTDPFMTKSVMNNLLASTESEEDFLSYAQRAYHLIRNKAVDEAVDALGESTVTMMSMEASLPRPLENMQASQDAVLRPIEEEQYAKIIESFSDPIRVVEDNDIISERPSSASNNIPAQSKSEAADQGADVVTSRPSTSTTSRGLSRPSTAVVDVSAASKEVEPASREVNSIVPESRPTTSKEVSRPSSAKHNLEFESKENALSEEKQEKEQKQVPTVDAKSEPVFDAKQDVTNQSRDFDDLTERLGITSDDDEDHSVITARVTEDHMRSTLRIQTNIVEMPSTPGMSTLGTTNTRPNTKEAFANSAAPTLTRPSTSQSTATHGTLAEAQWIKQQVIVDQLRSAQSLIETDAVQAKLRRNQRRLRIGHQALVMLQQNGLYDGVGAALMSKQDPQRRKEPTPRPSVLLPEAGHPVTAFPAAVPSPHVFSRNASAVPSTTSTPTPTSHNFFPPQIPSEHVSSNKSIHSSGIQEPKARPRVSQPHQEFVRSNPSPPSIPEPRDQTPSSFVLPKEEFVKPGPTSSNSHKSAVMGGMAWEIETEGSGKQKSRPRSPARLNLQAQQATDQTNTTPSKLPPFRGNQQQGNGGAVRANSSSNIPNVDVVQIRRARDESSLNPASDGQVDPPSSARGNIAVVQAPRSSSSGRSRSAGRSRDIGSKLSNYAQAKNAISYVCLAGAHQEDRRMEVLELLDYYHSSSKNPHSNPAISSECVLIEELKGQVAQFVLMFHKSKSLAFKGIYVLDASSKSLIRIFGKGPGTLSDADPQIKEYMKFETSSKAFKDLPVKSISSTVDAIILEPPKQRPPL